MLPRLSDVECSVILRSVLAIGNALTYLWFSGNVPMLHTSRYVIVRDQFHQDFPCVSTASKKRWYVQGFVLQATNTGMRRPGYEARVDMMYLTSILVDDSY